MIEYKGYTGVFEYDPELEVFTGHVVDIDGEVRFEAKSVAALRASMYGVVDHYLDACEKTGREPVKPRSS